MAPLVPQSLFGCVAAALGLILAVAPFGAEAQHCATATNCEQCISLSMCGWCSVPVVYSDNTTGPQCAGFDPGHSRPFVCPAIYSTESCQRGWLCNTLNGTCQLAAPGYGTSQAQCEADCQVGPPPPDNSVYLCDSHTKTCNKVPPGTPGSTSLLICEAICEHKPTASPGPVQQTYLCNTTTWTCNPCAPGHGASQLVCDQTCNNASIYYVCNPAAGGCQQVPPGTGGVPLATCLTQCNSTSLPPNPTLPPNPGPPPEYLGVWRGVEIQNNYKIVEWDMSVNITTVVFTRNFQSGRVTQVGIPFHVPNSAILEFWIMITSGPGAGSYLRTIGDTSGENGPQTSFGTMAVGHPGGPRPSTIKAAMTDGVNRVIAWTKCIVGNPFCNFVMPSQSQWRKRMMSALAMKAKAAAKLPAKHAAVAPVEPVVKAKFYDQCSQYGSACQTCLQHAYCGWCSVDVVYSDGTTGTQCAGFQGNSSFVCDGTYSTTSCEVGYICTSQQQCIETNPGDGMPQAVCLATCKPTPPPNPLHKQYVCNLVTHQCTLCTAPHCPGSMPLAQCESLCPNPTPGPTPDMVGVWRGIYIQNNYPIGEVDLVLNSTGAFFYVYGALYFTANGVSLGADVMLWSILTGPWAGKSIGVLYQMATTFYGMYWQSTMALGQLDQNFPTDYNTPMYTHGMSELVLAQCLQAPCQFHSP